MPGSGADVAAVARAYRRCYERSRDGRQDRLHVDEHWWARELVEDEVRDGDYRMHVGAGPLEELRGVVAEPRPVRSRIRPSRRRRRRPRRT